MDAGKLIKAYLDFFKSKGHAVIKGAPLVPENDPSVLFTTAGMHPLVPFLLGEPHPQGRRLTDVQKCLRTGDIDDVGDDTHLTFFEMLGNWSLGDYFKKESLAWSFEFLTKVLKINPDKIFVTVFEGDKIVPKDYESFNTWIKLGIPEERIYFLPRDDNWWGLETGPCGPDSEIFIDSGKKECSKNCKPGCSCGKYVEVWNNVFMEYNKDAKNNYTPLAQKNVDTGMGVERMLAMLENKKSVYDTALFTPLVKIVEKECKKPLIKSVRVIVDHVRAATFILGDEIGALPSRIGRGYVLRRLIRRAIRHCKLLGINASVCNELINETINIYKKRYPILSRKKNFIIDEFNKEVQKFSLTLDKGLNVFEKLSKKNISGMDAFLLYQSYGFPVEMTQELAEEKGLKVDMKGFSKEFEKHQSLSRKSAENKFKGGLANSDERTVKLHTATHLLAQSLREVLKEDVKQKGSNITSERLRFDFTFSRALTKEELSKVEAIVNKKIKESLPVTRKEMTPEKAKRIGAQAEFSDKYGDKVFVYFIGDFSREVCGGPHVKNTKELSDFKIIKEESISSGVRRIRAVLE